MLSDELKNKLISYLDFDYNSYDYCKYHRGLSENERQHIIENASEAINNITYFSEIDGCVAIGNDNITVLWKCIEAITACMRPLYSSLRRSETVLSVYQFLSNFRWTGMLPHYISYNGWGPLIYELTVEQLSYYLWWREEAKNGVFNVVTGEYLWLYIYDIVLNTCYDDSNQSLVALEKLYDSYERLSPGVTHLKLSCKKLGYFIVNYVIYNGIPVNINELIKTYGVDDTFNIYDRISNGCFKGSERHLLSLATSAVGGKRLNDISSETLFMVSIIAEVFEQISIICKDASINLLGDFCGTLTNDALWNPFESPVLKAETMVKTVQLNKHVSFSIGENPYFYVADDDLSADYISENEKYIFYHNGYRCYRKGFYYRKEYSGPNDTARTMVNYVIREIQNSIRLLLGRRTLKEIKCPYQEIKCQIDSAIISLVKQYYRSWQQNENKSEQMLDVEYNVLTDNQVEEIKSLYGYIQAKQNNIATPNYSNEKNKETFSTKKENKSDLIESIATIRMLCVMLEAKYKISVGLSEDYVGHEIVSFEEFFVYSLLDFLVFLAGSHDSINQIDINFMEEYIGKDINYKKILSYEPIIQKHGDGEILEEMFEGLIQIDNFNYTDHLFDKDDLLSDILYGIVLQLGVAYLNLNELTLRESFPKFEAFLEKAKNNILDNLKNSTALRYIYAEDLKGQINVLKKKQMRSVELVDDNLQQYLSELNSLIGLRDVKQEVNSIINLIQIQNKRKERGIKEFPMSLHMVFTGNPGTGKTTVARIVGNIYREIGVLSKGHLVEVDRSGLVAGYVGQTAIKTKEVIEQALGGVLFIDEAYSLNVENSDNDFGHEAIEILLKSMEDYRENLVVIVAGYDELMSKFINSNPGLKSRFNRYIKFPDYNGDELLEIFMTYLDNNQYNISEDAKNLAVQYFSEIYMNRDDSFGNARDVRNFFETLVSIQANRLITKSAVTNDDLTTIILEDVQQAMKSVN